MAFPWEPPANLDEAQERVLTLTDEIENIDGQLGDRRRIVHTMSYKTVRDGKEMTLTYGDHLTPDEYFNWRKNAKMAKTIKLRDLRRTKHWIHIYQRTANA